MSWFSQFVHNPGDFISENPGKALGLLAAPFALAAAPFLAPELAAGAGLFGAGEAAVGAGAEAGALGLAGAEVGVGATEASTPLSWLLEGPGGPFAQFSGNAAQEAPTALSSLTNAPELAPGVDSFSTRFAASLAGADPTPIASSTALDASAAPSSGPSWLEGAQTQVQNASFDGSGGQSFWDKLVGKVTDNPLKAAGIGVAGAGLAYNMAQGSRQSPEMNALSGQAAQLNQQQAQLMSYLQKGTLPPGLQSAVSSATSAMKARIISNHARNGMSTDPSQNSALAQELNNVDLQAVQLIAQQGVQLMNSGLAAAGISSQLYGMLEKFNRDQAKSTGQAIANFAAALSGGSGFGRPQGPGYFIPSGA